ncbi:hypothetical protein [Pseudomonas cremoricolorata]|uniref:Uncharacterized protein n=1 Tax=Pseudomonas cremoricolorata TaxID=157783 RepID=A0A089WVA9_9PSED|nr:hypothetical protein [Pseudomonas cremoricolorata]AIR90522.1 hypothetical protein LK03_15060 [Pseudomonas cremoricolorata]
MAKPKGRGWTTPPTLFREEVDEAVATRSRVIAMALLREIVTRSPVGNPDLWQANRAQKSKNLALADAYDARALAAGRKKLTKKERDQNYFVNDLAAGKGYIGGRFRGNNFVTVGAPSDAQLDVIDKVGSATIANGEAALQGLQAYTLVYIQNNLPYAEKLEDGHSTQAPGGIYAVSFNGVAQAYST